jgi:amidohydrolase
MTMIQGYPGKSRDIAESVAPDGIDRRKMLGTACACGLAALFDLKSANTLAADTVAGPARVIHAKLDADAQAIESKMIAWRRDIHQNPELGNQEVRTAGLVAQHLQRLGYEVRDKVAVTGVVATLVGGAGPGPVAALRADMDALPVTEPPGLPFASTTRAVWGGEDVGVMHACGHDCHVAIMMAVSEILAAHRGELRGTVKLIFQPAEENLPNDEIGGARRMLAEGAFDDPKPDAMFGLHVLSMLPAGMVGYRAGVTLASTDEFRITVTGRQTHAAFPWSGVDPIVAGAQIVSALQTIESRQVNVAEPSVLSVATFHGGNRANIIPNQVVLSGTLRAMSEDRRQYMRRRTQELAESVARGMDASATVEWFPNGYANTVNDPALTARMVPTLARVVGVERVRVVPPLMAADDVAYFAQATPTLFFWVGITPPDQDVTRAAPNHSPLWQVDEAGMLPGLRSLLHLVADYTGSGTG